MRLATPPNITYHTPRANHDTTMAEETENKTSCHDNSPTSKFVIDSIPEYLGKMPVVGEMTFLDDEQINLVEEGSVERDTTSDSSVNGAAPSVRGCIFTAREAINLNASLDLAYIHRMNNRLNDCEFAYRRVVAGCKKLYWGSFLFTLQAISALAVLRDERKGWYSAMPICGQIIEGFEELGTVVDRREYQHHLRDFIFLLRRTDSSKESVVLLCSTTTESNKLGLKHQEISAIRSLLESYLELNRLGDLKSLMSEMRKVLDEGFEMDSNHLPELLSERDHIANARSMLEDFVCAHPIFSSMIPKLQQLSNAKYGLQNVHEHQLFGLYDRSREVALDVAKYLWLAHEGLVKLGRQDDAVTMSVKATLIEVLLAEFEELFLVRGICRDIILQHVENRLGNMLLEETGQTESSMGNEKNNEEDDTKTDTTSCKYGVTYSVSEITGISDSAFMVP